MGMFLHDEPDYFPDIRPVGFPRYRQILERDWKRFLLTNMLTLISLLPLGVGVGYAVLSSSVLVLIPACLIGGVFAGPGIAGMYDSILRGLRDEKDDWWLCYKKAMRQNLLGAILPGILYSLFVGFYIFAVYMLWVSGRPLTLGTAAILSASGLLFLMVYSVWWPQIVLFRQRPGTQLKNCVLFCIQFFWRTLLTGVLQLGWWVLFVVFLPWTAFLVPVLGVWYLWFLCCFLLYRDLDKAFRIEEQLHQAFPDRYESK
ncbi:MAG TPA: hypothetical protein IAB79_07525 [Candidatus Faecousia excrementipullorum]|nr:hypothetical protein [Candidatus Faecousia excrementipullorum]